MNAMEADDIIQTNALYRETLETIDRLLFEAGSTGEAMEAVMAIMDILEPFELNPSPTEIPRLNPGQIVLKVLESSGYPLDRLRLEKYTGLSESQTSGALAGLMQSQKIGFDKGKFFAIQPGES